MQVPVSCEDGTFGRAANLGHYTARGTALRVVGPGLTGGA